MEGNLLKHSLPLHEGQSYRLQKNHYIQKDPKADKIQRQDLSKRYRSAVKTTNDIGSVLVAIDIELGATRVVVVVFQQSSLHQ